VSGGLLTAVRFRSSAAVCASSEQAKPTAAIQPATPRLLEKSTPSTRLSKLASNGEPLENDRLSEGSVVGKVVDQLFTSNRTVQVVIAHNRAISSLCLLDRRGLGLSWHECFCPGGLEDQVRDVRHAPGHHQNQSQIRSHLLR